MKPIFGAIVLTINDNWKILFWIIVPNYGILFLPYIGCWQHLIFHKTKIAKQNSLSESKIILHLILFF